MVAYQIVSGNSREFFRNSEFFPKFSGYNVLSATLSARDDVSSLLVKIPA